MGLRCYGNYGGLGWTNGRYGETGPPASWTIEPKDSVDRQFKEHDSAYYYAQKRRDETGDLKQYWREIIEADQAVINGIEALPQTELDVNQRAAGSAAVALFRAKQITTNYPGYEGGNNPSIASEIGNPFTGLPWLGLSPGINIFFTAARNFVIRRDPLVLDLDNDGLELIGASGAVLFDHNADGIKTGTGWARPDDGFLVRDLNGNGLIDTGRELFGIDTIKGNSALATDGFDALRELDTNNDGVITSADTAFSELKVWRDLDQNGISSANELFTLDQLNITSINTNGTSTGPQAGQVTNNNRVALSSTFTQNGQTKTVGAIDLEANNFFTQFPTEVIDTTGTPIAITTQAQGLPQMNGAGMVRDMRAAASLDGDFAASLTAFAAGTTRDEQRGMLDELVKKWSETSSFVPGLLGTGGISISYTMPPGITVAQYTTMINVLEKFNGSRFYGDNTGGPRPTGFAIQSATEPTTGNVTYSYIVSPAGEQVALLRQAFDALKESVYAALVPQTRLRPYTDQIGLVIDSAGIRFDVSNVIDAVQAKTVVDPYNSVVDLVELHKYAGPTVKAVGWEPYKTLSNSLETLPISLEIQNFLTAEKIVALGAQVTNQTVSDSDNWTVIGNNAANTLTGLSGNDSLFGFGSNDTISGGAGINILDGGDDVLYCIQNSTSNTLLGGAGNDTLSVFYYGSSNNLFEGGTGNDTITGSYYANTYVFNAGDGQDTITSYSGESTSRDVLRFGAGITAGDVTAVRAGENLVFKLAGSTDQVTVNN